MSRFEFVDLFSGIGGTRAAYEREGGECVFSCEIDGDAQEVYEKNWDEPVTEQDIRHVEAEAVPPHDLLLACWPCPSFSQMGKLDGLEDERGMLFYHIVQILKEKQPKAFMLENVKNLRFVKDGSAYETVVNALRECGYTVHSEVLNALDFGLPQHRERLIIVGFRDDIAPKEFDFPTENENALRTEDKQRAALADILEDNPDEKYFASDKVQTDRLDAVDDPSTVPEPSVWHENRSGLVTTRPYSGTLRASSSWHYLLINGKRNPTVRELLRLQGFPEWFEISDSNRSRARRLTGNTVPIPMVHTVAKALLEELNIDDTSASERSIETAMSNK
ncbi:DNA (cytosine-5)-methyltransferase 1 [Halopelagius inordinatus]|uniref:DNA (Cytosine-5)-methyltransferase 1 n=1 Tax=Halopelagius inordinatus TaxID=553467 RepID=A0A1I2NAN7_9EURY|nr:DNA cytosine methyltransferase [Halopelagius inordinatus]SFG00578.1 DNA (cytosine-5)-methyltransferase 1 [Halopelagius inordinatus]